MNKKILLLVSILATGLVACTQSQIRKSINVAGNLVEGFTVTKQQLVQEARLSAREMDRRVPIAASSSQYAIRLEKLTKGLHSYDGLKFNYKVYLVNDINAFAMPDGTVRIYSGLMDMMNDDEVVAVIGHEIGHVAKEHSLIQYKKAYVAKAAKEGLTSADGTIGRIVGAYGDVAEDYLNAQFSQTDELESDVYGVNVLYKLGRDPYAAAGAQEKLQSLGGKDSIFSSHPPSQERIDLARKEADKVTGKQ